jgi:hypothetical protein
MAREAFKQPYRDDRGVGLRQQAGAVARNEREELLRRLNSLVGDTANSIEEEVQPALPIPVQTHCVQPAVGLGPVPFEEERQVKERLAEQPPRLQQHADEQAFNAPVSVEVGVDGLQLDVDQACAHKRVKVIILGVDEPFQRRERPPRRCGGGGTNTALPGREPPIQFWLRRSSPGNFGAPRAPRDSRARVAVSTRIDKGGPVGSASLARAKCGASMVLQTSSTSALGRKGSGSPSVAPKANRSTRPACVPSICEEMTASLRTKA